MITEQEEAKEKTTTNQMCRENRVCEISKSFKRGRRKLTNQRVRERARARERSVCESVMQTKTIHKDFYKCKICH